VEELIEIIVDRHNMLVERNIFLLQALSDRGIAIPSLCFNASLGAYGSCGLCIVETCKDDVWLPRHACLVRPEAGLQIRTASPRIQRLRAHAARLLLKRGPFLKKEVEALLLTLVKEGTDSMEPSRLAGSLEGSGENHISLDKRGCLLCGLCVRICRKIGKCQLTFLGRGKSLRVGLVSGDSATVACGSCRACRHICPTGFITPDARQAFTARLYR